MKSQVIFCALARDCARRLRHNAPAFQKLQNAFPQAKWVFVENDSRDGTRAWLENWAKRDTRVTVLGTNTGELTIPRAAPDSNVIPGYSLHRIQRMASFRNFYLDWIEQYCPPAEGGIVVVIDPDVRSLPTARMIHWIQNLPSGQAVTALGLRWRSPLQMEFHDAYAYREREDLSTQTQLGIQLRRLTLARRLKGTAPLHVRSNFNGLGIYPAAALCGCRYQALENHDAQVEAECEHVPFHDQLAAQGVSILIDPQLKIVYNGWLAVTTGTHRARLKRWLTARLRPAKSVAAPATMEP